MLFPSVVEFLPLSHSCLISYPFLFIFCSPLSILSYLLLIMPRIVTPVFVFPFLLLASSLIIFILNYSVSPLLTCPCLSSFSSPSCLSFVLFVLAVNFLHHRKFQTIISFFFILLQRLSGYLVPATLPGLIYIFFSIYILIFLPLLPFVTLLSHFPLLSFSPF